MLNKRILHKLADICSGLANCCCHVCVVAVRVCAHVPGIVNELPTHSPLLPAGCCETEVWGLRKRQSRKACQAIWNLLLALTSFLHCVIHFKKNFCFCFVECRVVSSEKMMSVCLGEGIGCTKRLLLASAFHGLWLLSLESKNLFFP